MHIAKDSSLGSELHGERGGPVGRYGNSDASKRQEVLGWGR